MSTGNNRMIMMFFLVLFYILSCVYSKKSSPATAVTSTASSRDRVNTLSTKIITNQEQTMLLSDSNFTRYITESPREYHAIIMFTALADRHQCDICKKVKATYDKVAKFYNTQYNFNTTSASSRLLFFVIDVDRARNIFSEYHIESAPHFYLLPPTPPIVKPSNIKQHELSSRAVIEGNTQFLEEIERLSGIKIESTIDGMPILICICVSTIILGYIVSYAMSIDVLNALTFYQSKAIWIILSLTCYSVGVSGAIYCLLRKVPFYGYTREGMVIFAGEGRDQYTLEGIIIALWSIGSGVSLYLMHTSSTNMRLPSIARHVLVIFFLSLFIVLSSEIYSTYVEKTGWYRIKDVVPSYIWSFFKSTYETSTHGYRKEIMRLSITKSSGLLKRLLRVSEYYLFECKLTDINSVKKKMSTLVYDYIMRYFSGSSSSSSSSNGREL